jgi:Cytochrome P460
MRTRSKVTLLMSVTVFATCGLLAQSGNSVPFPTGYRQWVHIATVYRGAENPVFKQQPCTKPCAGGVFQYFANAKALEGYRTGKFPDGAIIADEFMQMDDAPQQPATSYEGARRGVGVMVKDSSKYAPTGGWGFESFKGDSRQPDHSSASCYGCHNAFRKEHDLTFLSYKEMKTARE